MSAGGEGWAHLAFQGRNGKALRGRVEVREEGLERRSRE